MESDLMYFDWAEEELCARFCRELNISQMPCIRDRTQYYHWDGAAFQGPFAVSETLPLRVDEFPFAIKVKDHFRKRGHEAAFVTDAHSRVVGVVHISDYNKPASLNYQYLAVLEFEQLLRSFLYLSGISNAEILNWGETKAATNDFIANMMKRLRQENYQERMQGLRPLQAFHLSDLLNYIHHTKMMRFDMKKIKRIKALRDRIMHSQDSVARSGELYDLRSLEDCIDEFQLLQGWHQQVAAELWSMTAPDRRERNRIRLSRPDLFLPWMARESMNRRGGGEPE